MPTLIINKYNLIVLEVAGGTAHKPHNSKVFTSSGVVRLFCLATGSSSPMIRYIESVFIKLIGELHGLIRDYSTQGYCWASC